MTVGCPQSPGGVVAGAGEHPPRAPAPDRPAIQAVRRAARPEPGDDRETAKSEFFTRFSGARIPLGRTPRTPRAGTARPYRRVSPYRHAIAVEIHKHRFHGRFPGRIAAVMLRVPDTESPRFPGESVTCRWDERVWPANTLRAVRHRPRCARTRPGRPPRRRSRPAAPRSPASTGPRWTGSRRGPRTPGPPHRSAALRGLGERAARRTGRTRPWSVRRHPLTTLPRTARRASRDDRRGRGRPYRGGRGPVSRYRPR